MLAFREPKPDIVTTSPSGLSDPLGQSVLSINNPALRFFEPQDLRIVIGRHQDPELEINVRHAQEDKVPIHRRVAGGGTVVLAPGMVVAAIRMPKQETGVSCYFDKVNACFIPAIAALIDEPPVCRGHGDLALRCADGQERKILGASLRQSREWVWYLGVFMVENALPLIDRYLSMPSRQPDYRADRNHADFCTHLSTKGVTVTALEAALYRACAPLVAV